MELLSSAAGQELRCAELGARVLGVGCRTAVGMNARATTAAYRAGLAGFRAHSYLMDAKGDPVIAAALPGTADCSVRLESHALGACLEASQFVRSLRREVRVNVALALPEKRPGVQRLGTDFVQGFKERLEKEMSVARVAVSATGHAAGALCLRWCAERLAEDRHSLCVIGGIDSYLDADSIDWLQSEELLKSEGYPFGFIPGEAAVFLLIGASGVYEQLPGPAWPHFQSVGTAIEPHPRKGDGICVGDGLTAAARQALSGLPKKLDYALCDLNSDRYRADEFAYTTVRVSDCFNAGVTFHTPADCVGDVGAATWPLYVVLANRPPRSSIRQHILILNSSENGCRAATVVHSG